MEILRKRNNLKVLLLLFIHLSFFIAVNGQVVFDDDGPPPQNQNAQQQQNQNPNVQTTRQQLPFLSGLNNLPQQIGNLVNQFLSPFQQNNNNNRQPPQPTRGPPPGPSPGESGGVANCQTFQQTPGTCIALRSCDTLNNILRSSRRNRANNILRQSVCGFSGFGPLVCCPVPDEGGFQGGNGNNGGFQGGNGNNGGFSGGNGGFSGGNGGFSGGNNFPQTPPPPPPTTSRPVVTFAPPTARTTTTTTTTEPFGDGGPATLFPPTKKPKPTGSPGLITGGDNTGGGVVLKIPGTNIDCGFSNASHSKIIGGKEAEIGAWPWMSALGYRDKDTGGVNFLCGGALVADQYVVTAAHCVHNRDDLAIVRLGDHDLFSDGDGVKPLDVPIADVIKNPNYNPTTFQNDIAVLRLRDPVPFTRAIHPICLPYTPQLRSNRFETANPFVAGWGAIQFNGPSSATLREVQLPIVDDAECQEKYRPFKTSKVDDTNICAGFQKGGKDACQGDSGGPLMYPDFNGKTSVYVLIGVVSYGFRCAEPGYPGVYSRVTNHVDWIEKIITQ